VISAEAARHIILEGANPAGEEELPLADAAWRVLARDLTALRTQPPFAASAMDGYAVRQADIAQLPVTLAVTGSAAAGHPFNGNLANGEAIRIFTGAPVPAGADTIVIQENTKAAAGSVKILSHAAKGKYIRPAGLDFRQGETLLHRGELLNPLRLSLAAAMNHPNVIVYEKPRIALLATGDELVAPGGTLKQGSIIASNTYGLAAIIRENGGELLDLGIVADDEADIAHACNRALEMRADLLVTTGGASVGDHDLIKPVLEKLGAVFEFTRIAMRPGKPMLFGNWHSDNHQMRICGLAGNPVSSLIAGLVFVRPLVAALAGRTLAAINPQPAILGRDLPANDEREEYMRASATSGTDGQMTVTPFDNQDSAMLADMARAQALLVRPANAAAAKKGGSCLAIPVSNLLAG
jgi:molybdopterin molybdotransferase